MPPRSRPARPFLPSSFPASPGPSIHRVREEGFRLSQQGAHTIHHLLLPAPPVAFYPQSALQLQVLLLQQTQAALVHGNGRGFGLRGRHGLVQRDPILQQLAQGRVLCP